MKKKKLRPRKIKQLAQGHNSHILKPMLFLTVFFSWIEPILYRQHSSIELVISLIDLKGAMLLAYIFMWFQQWEKE